MTQTQRLSGCVVKIVRLIERSPDPADTLEAVAATLSWSTPMAVALVNGLVRQEAVKALRALYLAIRAKAGLPA